MSRVHFPQPELDAVEQEHYDRLLSSADVCYKHLCASSDETRRWYAAGDRYVAEAERYRAMCVRRKPS